MNVYLRKKKIGEGTYATIYLANEYCSSNLEKSTMITEPDGTFMREVAIKKIKRNSQVQGIDISSVREIKSLKSLKSPYIIELISVFRYNGCLNLVLEYLPYTLEDIIKSGDIIIMPSDIKAWLIMILSGLHEIHSKFKIHRDLKPNNILISNEGVLKLADFGLTRDVTNEKMSTQVITRWYRPPEILLGCYFYSFSADMWSLGCIMAEMFLRVPLFAADTDIKQLDLIFKALGTPPTEYFGNLCRELPITFKKYPKSDIDSLFSAAGLDSLNFMKSLLNLDPNLRPSAAESLKNTYFTNSPLPTAKLALIRKGPPKKVEPICRTSF